MQLGRLYNDLQALGGSVEQNLALLTQQQTAVLGQIEENQGALALQMPLQQVIEMAPAELNNLQTLIGSTESAISDIDALLEIQNNYGLIDTLARDLADYYFVISQIVDISSSA